VQAIAGLPGDGLVEVEVMLSSGGQLDHRKHYAGTSMAAYGRFLPVGRSRRAGERVDVVSETNRIGRDRCASLRSAHLQALAYYFSSDISGASATCLSLPTGTQND